VPYLAAMAPLSLGYMGAPLHLGSARRPLLAVAIALTVGGFLSLALVTNSAEVPAPHLVSPTFGTSGPFTSDPLAESTSTTLRRLHRTTSSWYNGGFFDGGPDQSSGPTTSGPQSEAPTQVDVAVPAAGAQVSAGQGDGSCTDVAITALTPENCPPPDGDGPVVVDPPPTSGPIIGEPKAGFEAA
jgi:hypothetical protein